MFLIDVVAGFAFVFMVVSAYQIAKMVWNEDETCAPGPFGGTRTSTKRKT